jgi:hypothetical protein
MGARCGAVAALMGFEAATLAAIAALHLGGVLADGSDPFDPFDAGVAEAVICVVLASGAAALLRRWPYARILALGAAAFAILGFGVGLNFTIRGGGAIDVAYHATVLPLLLVTLAALVRMPEERRRAATRS